LKAGASAKDIDNILLSDSWPEVPFINLAKLRGWTMTSDIKNKDYDKIKEINKLLQSNED
jgi:hypothetical protein